MGRSPGTEELLSARGAVYRDDGPTKSVAHFGDSLKEYGDLQARGLGLLERGERETLVMSGDDAIPWLQGLVTSDLMHLEHEGSGQRTALVNTTGRFVAEARLLHVPELLLWDLEAGALSGELLGHLRRHIITEKVRLMDRSEATGKIAIFGPEAAAVLEKVATWHHNLAGRKLFSGSWGEFQGEDLIVQRTRWCALDSFEVSCATEVVARLIEAIEQAAEGLVHFGDETFEMLRIEAGVPRLFRELHDKVIPLEAGFSDAISFTKGCYLGQEIIARLDTLGTPAKLLRRLVLEGDQVPEKGAPVTSVEGKKAGHVESAVYSPAFDGPVALGFVKRNFNHTGESVLVDGVKAQIEGLLDFEEV